MRLLPAPALLALAMLAIVAPAAAQAPPGMPTKAPGSPDPALAQAGTYQIEPNHTQIGFSLDHMGFTPFSGVFSRASGTLTIDPRAPASAKVAITVPIASVLTTSAKLDEELASPQFFDAAKYPTATFVSSTITPIDATDAKINGTLTLHGVARPLSIVAKFYGAGTNFMTRKPSVGFTGTATVKRSDYGIGYGVPLVGDDVTLTIAAAFEQ